jgi:hypothetical protein
MTGTETETTGGRTTGMVVGATGTTVTWPGKVTVVLPKGAVETETEPGRVMVVLWTRRRVVVVVVVGQVGHGDETVLVTRLVMVLLVPGMV